MEGYNKTSNISPCSQSVSDVFFTGALLSSQEEVYLVELGQRI